jgi:hypothetical protein
MLNILEFSVLAVAVVIPVAANLLWHLIETDLNDTGKKTAHPSLAAFCLEVLLMRIPAVLGGSAPRDGRMSATTMPSSPPGTIGRP